MPQRRAEDNRGSSRGGLLLAVVAAQALTVAHLVRTEVLGRTGDAEVAEILARANRDVDESARYDAWWNGQPVGSLESMVAGSAEQDQLAYLVVGRLDAPVRVTIRATVFADRERRLQHVQGEVDVAGVLHSFSSESTGRELVISWEAVGTGTRRPVLVFAEPPVLAPGPVPLPPLAAAGFADRGVPERVLVGGRERAGLAHGVGEGDHGAVLVVDAEGFPLLLRLPLGLEIRLVEDTR